MATTNENQSKSDRSDEKENGSRAITGRGEDHLDRIRNRFFLCLPPEFVNDDTFPFKPGTLLVLDIVQGRLVIQEDGENRKRVPLVESNSHACWFMGNCRSKQSESS